MARGIEDLVGRLVVDEEVVIGATEVVGDVDITVVDNGVVSTAMFRVVG